VFNVGSGIATDVLKVATTLRQYLDSVSDIAVSGQYRAGDIRHNVADLEKVSRLLSFKAQVTFEEGLRRFVDWVRSERIADDRYEESLDELRAKGLLK
jgi:dTDP-L-rhamnose 4-epimerase